MLEIKFVRQNLEQVKAALAARGTEVDIDSFVTHDAQRRKVLVELEELRHRRNIVSDQIADMKKSGENADGLVKEMRDVSGRIKSLDKALAEGEGLSLRASNCKECAPAAGETDFQVFRIRAPSD